jgi:mannose-6-phosphate isomerase class I
MNGLAKKKKRFWEGVWQVRSAACLTCLKVLDVRQMLSIQVHPDKASAAAAFEEENRKGIPLNAPQSEL